MRNWIVCTIKVILLPIWVLTVPFDCIVFKLWKGWDFRTTLSQSWNLFLDI